MSLSFKLLRQAIRKAYTFLIFSGLTGIGFSIIAFFYVQSWENEHVHADLQKKAHGYVYDLRQAFTNLEHILVSVGGLQHVLGHINQEYLTSFIGAQPFNNSWLYALEWVPCVSAVDYASGKFTDSVGKPLEIWELSAEGKKQPVSQRDTYYPILLIEPENRKGQNRGYDLGSNEVLKAALEKAQTRNQATLSGLIPVTTANGDVLGARVFVPVYQQGKNRTLVGFVAGVVLIRKMIEDVVRPPKSLKKSLFLHIVDNTPGSKITDIYRPTWYQREAIIHAQTTKSADAQAIPIVEVTLEIGGRQWLIAFVKPPGITVVETYYAWIVLGIGLLFTIGLWRYLQVFLGSARWAEELAAKRTRSLSKANQALNGEIERREQVTKALKVSQQRFQAIFDEAAMGIVQTDLEGRILNCNKALQELLGYSEDELRGLLLKDFAHPQDRDLDKTLLSDMEIGTCDAFTVSKRYRCKDAMTVWTNQSCSIVRTAEPPFIINLIEDVTEQKCAEQARLEAEKKYRDIFENAVEGIFQCTPTGYFLSVNPSFVRIFGYDSAEQMLTEVTNMGKQLYASPQRRDEFDELLRKHSKVQNFEYEARCRNGRIIWVNETVRVVRDVDGQIRYYEGIVEDVTKRKYSEEKLRYDATHDQLTGLLNRAAFTEYLATVLNDYRVATATKPNWQPVDKCPATIEFSVLFVDLDRFKIVNDSMGHLTGDKMLTEVARRLCKSTRPQDIVARFGGDEFAIMFENINDLTTLQKYTEQIQAHLNQPYFIENETFNTTASIGIALPSPHYKNANEVLRDADTAMYEAKRCGRSKIVVFQPGMHTHVVNILRLESDLRKALDNKEFNVYYQPIISLEDSHTVGLEALVRWVHPERGIINPDQFIPVAEETGLIVELGLWVFETACAQLRCWQKQFPAYSELGININVSPVQLKQPRLVRQIQDIISKLGIKASTCRIEITESAMMHDPEVALNVLRELKNLEVLLYVDDFGTGYSSLSYLQKFPLDALKIDKSFIRDINNLSSGKPMNVTRAIIALGEAFNLKVVAEGVENTYQVSLLKAARCHHGQGYFFSKPKNTMETESYLMQTLDY